MKLLFTSGIVILAGVVIGICGNTCLGTELTYEFRTQHHFSVTLPAGWIQVPQDVLETYTAIANVSLPNGQKQRFDYAFQLAGEGKWFKYPYILIMVDFSGRVPEAQFRKIRAVDFRSGLEDAGKTSQGILKSAEIGEVTYEPEKHIFWFRLSQNVVGVGSVKAVQALLLTEKGYIQVMCYDQAENFDQSVGLLMQIVRNIQLDEQLIYKPRFMDSVPIISEINWERVFTKGLVGALVGLIIALFMAIFQRKNLNHKG